MFSGGRWVRRAAGVELVRAGVGAVEGVWRAERVRVRSRGVRRKTGRVPVRAGICRVAVPCATALGLWSSGVVRGKGLALAVRCDSPGGENGVGLKR